MHSLYKLTPGAHEIDSNGFLRVPLRILSVGVMAYSVEELGDSVPLELRNEPLIKLLVTPEALEDPRAIRSLEGMPLTAGTHDWQGPSSNTTQVGNIAGTPRVDGPYLVADGLVTNQESAQCVIDRLLPEISAAYDMDIVWEPGEYAGDRYHGRQTRLRYNHTTLLPAGEGRGGHDVRVLNQSTNLEETTMSNGTVPAFTLVNLPGARAVRVANEDANAVSDAVEKAASEAKETTATAFNEQISEIAEQLKAANEAKAAAEATVAELNGKIQEMQDQLSAAMSPEAVASRAEELQNEKEEAAQVMNASTLPEDLRKLNGHALRTAVIGRVRASNSLPALTESQLSDEAGVKGRWGAMVEMAVKPTPLTTVPGAKAVRVANSEGARPQSLSRERLNKLYSVKEV